MYLRISNWVQKSRTPSSFYSWGSKKTFEIDGTGCKNLFLKTKRNYYLVIMEISKCLLSFNLIYKPNNSARSPTARVPQRIIKAKIAFTLNGIEKLNFCLIIIFVCGKYNNENIR